MPTPKHDPTRISRLCHRAEPDGAGSLYYCPAQPHYE